MLRLLPLLLALAGCASQPEWVTKYGGDPAAEQARYEHLNSFEKYEPYKRYAHVATSQSDGVDLDGDGEIDRGPENFSH